MATREELETLKVGILGLGNMSGAILKGLLDAGLKKENCWAVCSCPESATRKQEKTGIRCFGPKEYAEEIPNADVLLLGVKPYKMNEVLNTLSDLSHKGDGFKPGAVVVSVAAGTTLETMHKALRGHDIAVIRTMPNTPALVGKGVTALCCAEGTNPAQRDLVSTIFRQVGKTFWMEEKQLNAFTGLFGSGPAYAMVMMEALAEAGLAQGLPHGLVWEAVPQLLQGSAALVQQLGKPPAQLKAEVITPAGTTIAGLTALEAANVRTALFNAVEAATTRANELSAKA